MRIKSDKEHFLNCNVAGFSYKLGCMVFNQLKVGTELRLVREDENPYDKNAVAVFYEDTHIGYIPHSENAELAKFLDLGYADIFETYVQAIDPAADLEHQVEVIIYIKRRK